VRGRRDGRPAARAQVFIARRDDGVAVMPTRGSQYEYNEEERAQTYTTTDAQGRWSFNEIPDGRYTIVVKPREGYELPDAEQQQPGVTTTSPDVAVVIDSNMNGSVGRATRRKRSYAPARRDVEVSGSDVSEVNVELNDGGRVSGTVVYEGDAGRQYAYITFRRLHEADDAQGIRDVWGVASDSGQFELDGLPTGRYFISSSLNSEGGGGGAFVKSITWNGKDFTREPLEVGDGASIEGMRIVMSKGTSRLRVRATGAMHKWPARAAVVYLLPADLSTWSPYGAQFFCTADDEGLCTIIAPPGSYRVVALPRPVEVGVAGEDLRRRGTTATVVMLTAGEAKDFELVVPER
jgi:hypothetical protein